MPKRKLLRSKAANPIIGSSIERLLTGDLTLRNVMAKALWLKKHAAGTSNNFNIKELALRIFSGILQSYQRINSLLIVKQEVSIYSKFVKEWNQYKTLC